MFIHLVVALTGIAIVRRHGAMVAVIVSVLFVRSS
jgi:hypothetical protein